MIEAHGRTQAAYHERLFRTPAFAHVSGAERMAGMRRYDNVPVVFDGRALPRSTQRAALEELAAQCAPNLEVHVRNSLSLSQLLAPLSGPAQARLSVDVRSAAGIGHTAGALRKVDRVTVQLSGSGAAAAAARLSERHGAVGVCAPGDQPGRLLLDLSCREIILVAPSPTLAQLLWQMPLTSIKIVYRILYHALGYR